MADLSKISDEELVSKLISFKTELDSLKKRSAEVEAELQTRALKTMLNKNVKTVQYSSHLEKAGNARVGTSYTLEVINYEVLKDFLTESVFKDFISKSEAVTYSIKAALKKALIAICEKDYDYGCTLEDVFKSLDADEAQQKLLIKKLKGDFCKDNALLISIFGERDYEEEIYYVYKYKNTELIKKFFPHATEEDLESLREAMVTDSKVSITIEPL